MKLVEAVRDERSLDFWIGNWTTRWKDGGGRSHRGSNVILKLDRGIRELFEGPSKPRRYVGVSVSEWNPRSSVWEQEYWDNSGYHAFFKGGWRGDRFILDQAYSETTPNPAPSPCVEQCQGRIVALELRGVGGRWSDLGKQVADRLSA